MTGSQSTSSVPRDLVLEIEALHALLATLGEADWKRPTLFKAWTPRDIVAHLHQSDLIARASVLGEEAFAVARRQMRDDVAAGTGSLDQARRTAAGLDSERLLATWRESAVDLARVLAEQDPRRRLPWFGPDMGVSMFATARLMETWAHGQAVYDLFAVPRAPTDRLRHIAVIGVRTFGFCFANRRRTPPGPPPAVRLESPSGEIWSFNDPEVSVVPPVPPVPDTADEPTTPVPSDPLRPQESASEIEGIEGSALDFCMVVTQVRHVRDTALRVSGPVARAWMEIAQCFAGPPVDPPAPGSRVRDMVGAARPPIVK